jgi:hypothetical protein
MEREVATWRVCEVREGANADAEAAMVRTESERFMVRFRWFDGCENKEQ